jgi:hypothetical protein
MTKPVMTRLEVFKEYLERGMDDIMPFERYLDARKEVVDVK